MKRTYREVWEVEAKPTGEKERERQGMDTSYEKERHQEWTAFWFFMIVVALVAGVITAIVIGVNSKAEREKDVPSETLNEQIPTVNVVSQNKERVIKQSHESNREVPSTSSDFNRYESRKEEEEPKYYTFELTPEQCRAAHVYYLRHGKLPPGVVFR